MDAISLAAAGFCKASRCSFAQPMLHATIRQLSFVDPFGHEIAEALGGEGLELVCRIAPAVAWLDAAKSHEISVAAGFTFNWENPDTDYRTGTEFHVEWALIQQLSKELSIGIASYHYQQISGDSGAGATLGDFEGRVTALGPVVTYSFLVGKVPVSTQLEYMHEFEAVNRAEGDMGMINVTMPLSVSDH